MANLSFPPPPPFLPPYMAFSVVTFAAVDPYHLGVILENLMDKDADQLYETHPPRVIAPTAECLSNLIARLSYCRTGNSTKGI
jgi:hypothetical protein